MCRWSRVQFPVKPFLFLLNVFFTLQFLPGVCEWWAAGGYRIGSAHRADKLTVDLSIAFLVSTRDHSDAIAFESMIVRSRVHSAPFRLHASR